MNVENKELRDFCRKVTLIIIIIVYNTLIK